MSPPVMTNQKHNQPIKCLTGAVAKKMKEMPNDTNDRPWLPKNLVIAAVLCTNCCANEVWHFDFANEHSTHSIMVQTVV